MLDIQLCRSTYQEDDTWCREVGWRCCKSAKALRARTAAERLGLFSRLEGDGHSQNGPIDGSEWSLDGFACTPATLLPAPFVRDRMVWCAMARLLK